MYLFKNQESAGNKKHTTREIQVQNSVLYIQWPNTKELDRIILFCQQKKSLLFKTPVFRSVRCCQLHGMLSLEAGWLAVGLWQIEVGKEVISTSAEQVNWGTQTFCLFARGWQNHDTHCGGHRPLPPLVSSFAPFWFEASIVISWAD